jgi:hypothetical protein
MQYQYRAVSNNWTEEKPFGEPRDTLRRAEKDAEAMKVASTQGDSRIQVRGIDAESGVTGDWSFLTDGDSS